MENLKDLLDGISAILWPIIVIVIILRFSPAIKKIIESAKSRKFTLKVGGQELTMAEANEQQQNMIADLQTQVIEIMNKLNISSTAKSDSSQVNLLDLNTIKEEVSPTSILWVDDNPKNNSYFVQQLLTAGIKVDLALSTGDGLKLFDRNKYRMLISDMGRSENGLYNTSAGLSLLHEIRKVDSKIPFVIYCSTKRAMESKSKAYEMGVTEILSSPTALAGIIKKIFPEWRT